MRRERATFLKIVITISLFAALPITFALTNSQKEHQDVRSKAAFTSPNPAKILFVPFSFSKDKDDDYLLDFHDKPQIRNGFVPQPQTIFGPQFTAIVLDRTGKILITQKFSLPQLVTIDSIDAKSKKGGAELKKVSGNNQGLTLPHHPDAGYLQIRNPKEVVIEVVSLGNASSINNIIDLKEIKGDDIGRKHSFYKINPLSINKAFAGNGTFNIAIIGDNYNGDNIHFQNDVNDIAAGLLSVEPFKTYKANIIFYLQLSTAQICSFTTSLTCNDTVALQQASSTPYDKIYVLYNGPYAGYAYLGATLAYGTNANNMTTAIKQGLFIHELAGHVLGGLMDEYSYGTTGLSYAPNCSDSSACPSWNTISGLGCFSSCGYTNLYRATDNDSVMNTALLSGTLTFDSFSKQVINGKLLAFLGASPPTPTLPPPVPTPTITPTLTPSIAPTLTIIPANTTPTPTTASGGLDISSSTLSLFPTPTVTVAPTLTLTPTPTFTPTPSQIPGCTFPNFCTQTKYCETENILPINCNSSAQVCCQFQIQPTNPPLNPQAIENTPTPVQRFEPLPTLIPSENNKPTPIPTTQATPTFTVFPNFTPSPTTKEMVSPTITKTSTLSPTLINSIENTPPIIPPSPVKSFEENYPIYPTPTTFSPENIPFERPTPTLLPKRNFLEIINSPTEFINNFFKKLFSRIFGK